MSFFTTPSKQPISKPNKTLSQTKNSDWVCVMCNNLNFSFRKKCNRCKTQTRLQNQNHIASAYSQYYYQSQESSNSDPKSYLSDATNLQTPIKASHQSKQQCNHDEKINISKLAKKYCPRTKLSNTFSSPKKQKFMSDFWEYINVADFDELHNDQKLQDPLASDQNDDQLQNLISKILIEDE